MTDGSDVMIAIIAAVGSIVTTVVTTIGLITMRKNRSVAKEMQSSMVTDGNGGQIGPAVHRIDQTVELMAANQNLQSQTLVEHGRANERLWEANKRSMGMLTDQRIELEEFVTKVSPLCEWVEQKQREEGTG
jgi:hypothetical protein